MRRILPCLILLALSAGLRAETGVGVETVRELELADTVDLPAMDVDAARGQDELRVQRGEVPHFAVAHEVAITPWSHGRWRRLDAATLSWTLTLRSPGALSLSLAFGRYRMPAGGRLRVASATGGQRLRPFTSADEDAHGQLWTPPVLTDALVLELTLPEDRLDQLQLEIVRVHHGYAGFGAEGPRSGSCQRDVACSEAAEWREVARSVGLMTVEGVRFCTGFLVNNTALDGRPFFMTAYHCGVSARNAASVVVIWGDATPACRRSGGLGLAQEAQLLRHFQTGADVRAAYFRSDAVLLELDDRPPAGARVFYAGWDRSPADPGRTAVIHHPNADAQRIALDLDGAVTTPHLSDRPNPRGAHLRIAAWDAGATEGGSSGAPLVNADRRVVGQLHGGYAACGLARPDWFGRFSVSWDGGGQTGTRLRDWLDPLDTGAVVLDGIEGAALRGR